MTELHLPCVHVRANAAGSTERIDLGSIICITKGVYITSTLASNQTNESKNVGIVVRYRPGKNDVARVNTRSLSTSAGTDNLAADMDNKTRKTIPIKILPFKAVPARSSFTVQSDEGNVASEIDRVNSLCEDIRRAALGNVGGEVAGFVEERPIISLAEARKNTGLVDQLGHALKRLVWG